MNDVFVHYADLGAVKACCTENEDGSYSVFINPRLSDVEQKKSLEHELSHILNDDFHSELSVDELETIRHRG